MKLATWLESYPRVHSVALPRIAVGISVDLARRLFDRDLADDRKKLRFD